MKNYINKIFGCALLTSATLLTSCGSDYLDTKPTSSVDSEAAVATTDMAYKALNGIARCQTTQHYAFSQGFAGENAIMRLYENLPSQNYNYNYYASGWAPIHNQTFHHRTITISSSDKLIELLPTLMMQQVAMPTSSLSRLQLCHSVLIATKN